MDELLYERVKQLKEIDDRIDRALKLSGDRFREAIYNLRQDIALMILEAERQHAEF